jgi:hypothetical protein
LFRDIEIQEVAQDHQLNIRTSSMENGQRKTALLPIPTLRIQTCRPTQQNTSGRKSMGLSEVYRVSSNATNVSREIADIRKAWIDSFEESGDDDIRPTSVGRLLAPPSQAHSAQHHFAATKLERRRSKDGWSDDVEDPIQPHERGLFGGPRAPERGRKWDHVRESEPVITRVAPSQSGSQWKTFVQSSMYGPALGEESEVVDEKFLAAQTPGYFKPWVGDIEGDDPEKSLGIFQSKKRRRLWYQRLQVSIIYMNWHHSALLILSQRLILMHPLVPLIFRFIVLGTSAIALGLSGSIYNRSRQGGIAQNPSTVMAIVVDVVAMPYIGYITWDEYTGKPLGLRSPKAKIRLVLLDLFFIIFESANLALAFAALTDKGGTCLDSNLSGTDPNVCVRARALCSFLFIALVAWGLTFTVSIFRVVERVGSRDDPE